jgi:hypothetical protein
VFPATTAAAALANLGDLFGDAEFLATMYVDVFLFTAPGKAGLEICGFAGDEAGVVALENRLIPEIEDLCWFCCPGTVGGFGLFAPCSVLPDVEEFSVILLNADGEGKFVSLLNVLTEELSQLTPELTDLPLLKPLELEVLLPNPLICVCLVPTWIPELG